MDAKTLLNNNLTPVLLGAAGDALKRPLQHNWQTKTVTQQDVATWPAGNNVGVRTGEQPDGRHLLVIDFDYNSHAVGFAFLAQAQAITGRKSCIVSTGKGLHFYYLTDKPVKTQKLAYSDQLDSNGRPFIMIETKGEGGQVVSAGSRHPNGHTYDFLNGSYDAIPHIKPHRIDKLLALARTFCKKPKPKVRQAKANQQQASSSAAGAIATDCLDYARRYIGNEAKKPERNGDIRFRGNGGLIVKKDGKGWFCFGDNIGGGLVDLVVWNEGITRAEAINKVYPPAVNFTINQTAAGYDIVLNDGEFLGDVDFTLPQNALLQSGTGTGKTSWVCSINGRLVLVVPTQALAEQLGAIYPHATLFYQFQRKITGNEQLIITTPNSIQKLLPKIDVSQFYLAGDEIHEFATAGGYRRPAYDDLAMCVPGQWKGVIFMTGTPFPLVWPGMTIFKSFRVKSPTRKQQAQLVYYQDAKGKGDKLQTAVSLMPPANKNRKTFVYLQNKKNQVDKLVYELKQLGYGRSQIAVLNSDTRSEPGQDSAHYLHLMENEQLPPGVLVVIATAIMQTGVNIKQHFDQVHFLSPVASIEAQQIANRFRLAAPGIVYDYLNKDATGAAVKFDVNWLADKIVKEAVKTADALNLDLKNTTTPEEEAFLEYKRKVSQNATQRHDIQFVPADPATLEPAYYQPSPAGVTHEIFKRFLEAERKNPGVYKNNLASYGWDFLPDLQRVITTPASDGRAVFVAECHEARMKKLNALGQQLLTDGYTATQTAVKASSSQTSLFMRNAQFALVLHGDKSQHQAGLVASWSLAVDGMLAAEDSHQKRNTLIRQLKIQADRQNPLTEEIYQQFNLGELLTGDEVAARLISILAADPVMSVIVRKRWKNDPQITGPRAIRFLRDYFQLKRTKRYTATSVDNCYMLIDDCPHIDTAVGQDMRVDEWASGKKPVVSHPASIPNASGSETQTKQPPNAAQSSPPPIDFDLLASLTTSTRKLMRQAAGTWA